MSLLTESTGTVAIGHEDFSPDSYEILRDSSVAPLHHSGYAGSETKRDSFIRGAGLLGLNTERKPLLPQQYVVADTLNADGATTTAVCAPRRVTKTSVSWAVALGRISDPELDSYQVAFTAQTGVKARQRFLKDVVQPLERFLP